MKRKLLLLWTFLLCMAGGMSATEMTQVITFKDSGTANDGTSEKSTVADIIASGSEFISSITASKVDHAAQGKGVKL